MNPREPLKAAVREATMDALGIVAFLAFGYAVLLIAAHLVS